MSLQIDSYLPIGPSSSLPGGTSQPASRAPQPSTAAANSLEADTISLNTPGIHLAGGFTLIPERVNQHHGQLINGTYSINGRIVATAMLDDHLSS